MNKKLLAIAVGAAVSFPAVALADGPTVYGKVNVSLEQVEEDLSNLDVDTESQWQLDSNASRLGVKGDFDLDVAGLKAIYQAEYEIAVDDGSDVFKQRNIFAGLAGGFGTLKAGMMDTPVKNSQGKVDQFNDLDGDIKTIMAGESRHKNLIQYTTPKLADAFEINVAVAPGEGNDIDQDAGGEPEDGIADTTYVSVVYDAGGIYAAAAMAQNEDDKGILDTDWFTDAAVAGDEFTADITRLTAGFKADAFEVGAIFQNAEAVGDGVDLEAQSILVSGAFKIDRVKLKAQYGMTTFDLGSGVDGEPEATLIALGADYKLAKASKAYVYTSKVEVDDDDLFVGEVLEDTTFGVGLEHKF